MGDNFLALPPELPLPIMAGPPRILREFEIQNMKLWEENVRLKKYVRELQQALVTTKTNVNSGLKEIELQEFDEPLSEVICEEGHSAGQSAMLNHLVLKNVFKNMDFDSLKNVRLVCSKWNNEAVLILTQKSIVGLSDPQKISVDKIHNFHSVLENTPNKRLLFENCDISSVAFTLLQVQNLFLEFGSSLKTLKIREPSISLTLLHNILVNWCPNLEDLKIQELRESEREDQPKNPFETIGVPKSLALKIFQFTIYERNAKLSYPLLCIAKASPQLQRLLGKFHPRVFADFFVQVLQYPDITKRLTHLNAIGSDSSHILPISFLSNVQFKNLKSLCIGPFPALQNHELRCLLEKVSKTLEFLKIVGYDWEHNLDFKVGQLAMPMMENLKVFNHFGAEDYRIDSIDILTKLPNLKSFRLRGTDSHPIESGHVDALFESEHLVNNPHLELEELILMGDITSFCSLFSLNVMFPNISTLLIQLGYGAVGNDRCRFFEISMEAISEMENLTDLQLEFRGDFNWDCRDRTAAALESLLSAPKLKHLTITTITVDGNMPSLCPHILEKFLNAHSLHYLKLIGFQMSLQNAEVLFHLLPLAGIMLEVFNNESPNKLSYNIFD